MIAGIFLGERVELQGPDRLRVGEPLGQPVLLELTTGVPQLRTLLGQLIGNSLFPRRTFRVMSTAAFIGGECLLSGRGIGKPGRACGGQEDGGQGNSQ